MAAPLLFKIMKKKKYRFNLKRFFLNFTLLLVLIILLFQSVSMMREYLNRQKNEEYFVDFLKKSMKSAGSEETFRIAREFEDKYPDSEYIGYAWFIEGKYHYERGDYRKSVLLFQKASEKLLDNELRVILYLHMSYNYMCLTDIVASSEYAQKVYDLLETGKLKALAAFQLGLCNRAFKLYDKAIFYFEQVDEITDDVELIKQAAIEKLGILKKVDLKKAEKFEIIFKKRFSGEIDEKETAH